MVNAHFDVATVDGLTVDQVKEAIRWVQEKIDAIQAQQLALPAPSLTTAHEFELQRIKDKADSLRATLNHAVSLDRELSDLARKHIDRIMMCRGIYGTPAHAMAAKLYTVNGLLFSNMADLTEAVRCNVEALLTLAESAG